VDTETLNFNFVRAANHPPISAFQKGEYVVSRHLGGIQQYDIPPNENASVVFLTSKSPAMALAHQPNPTDSWMVGDPEAIHFDGLSPYMANHDARAQSKLAGIMKLVARAQIGPHKPELTGQSI
jgi:hypothetical protein